MEIKRCGGLWIAVALLVLGNNAAAIPELNLDCTNDLDFKVTCSIEAQNCSEYNLTVVVSGALKEEKRCTFQQSNAGLCCCSVKFKDLVSFGKIHVIVGKEGMQNEPKVINISDTIKPHTPQISSITESNGNLKVVWTKNVDGYFRDHHLKAKLRYRVKGDPNEKSVDVIVDQITKGPTNYYEISGQELKPSTTYLVSVQSFIDGSRRFSDPSKEYEIKTSASSDSVPLGLIIGLSLAAVLISVAIFACYVKLKPKWWDKVWECPKPKLLDMHSSQQEILKPMSAILSSVSVEPLLDDSKLWFKDSLKDSSSGSFQQSSGISTGSSNLSYANTEPIDIIAGVQDALGKVFSNICPKSPLTTNPVDLNKDSLLCTPSEICDVKPDDMSSGSSCFLNKTYFILSPSSSQQVLPDSSAGQADMLCESAYHPSEGVTVSSTYQQAPASLVTLPPGEACPSMQTELSYQTLHVDSGRFSYAEDSGSSSLSSGTNTTAPCDLEPRLEKAVGVIGQIPVCDENPCYGSMPANIQSCPAVDYDYQPFQNVVEQPRSSIPEKTSDEEEELTGKYSEEPTIKMPQSLFNTAIPRPMNAVQAGQCLSEPQKLLSLVSSEQTMPVITESGYQCV